MQYKVSGTLWACSLGIVACTGAIDGSMRPGGDPGTAMAPSSPGRAGAGVSTPGPGMPGATATPGLPGTPGATPTSAQPAARLHRLTAREFGNSVRDLLGQDMTGSLLEPDLESDGLYSVGGSVVAVSPAGIARYEAAVTGAAERALGDNARATKLLGCVPQSAADVACATKAINALGRRAFRRPLTAAETARYVGVAQAIAQEADGGPLIGMRYAVTAILQSPSFLYRVELGAPSAVDGGRLKYSGHEMASRLASLLWGSVPDDPLLDAADTLTAPEGVRKQAERLLLHPNAKRAFRDFVDDLYGTEHLDTAIKDATIFRGWTATLRDSMREDLLRRLEDVVFGTPGDLLSVYDGNVVFVNNELARLYGVPAQMTDAFRRAELPTDSPRRGIATSGAILATYALPQRTSPTARGKFIAEVLLCKTVPLPPPGVDATLPMGAAVTASLREQLEKHRANPACAACHGLMDPIGLGLEAFDSIGTFRATEKGKPIDASGELDGAAFRSAAELGTRLREHASAASCFVDKLYTHAQGRSTIAVDDPALLGLTRLFNQSGRRGDRLLVDLVASDAYRFVEPIGRQEQK